MNPAHENSYENWLAQLQGLAVERGLQWMIASGPGAHLPGFETGLTPDEELQSLADMAEWRGCGCGGGGG